MTTNDSETETYVAFSFYIPDLHAYHYFLLVFRDDMYSRWRLSDFCLFEQGYIDGCELFEYVDSRIGLGLLVIVTMGVLKFTP